MQFFFFYQSKNQNTIKPQGSGLGLAICKQIIEQHNGKIWAKKGNKNGAIVGITDKVTLPEISPFTSLVISFNCSILLTIILSCSMIIMPSLVN